MTKNMEKDLYEKGNVLYTDSFSVRTWDGKSANSTVIAGGRRRADRYQTRIAEIISEKLNHFYVKTFFNQITDPTISTIFFTNDQWN